MTAVRAVRARDGRRGRCWRRPVRGYPWRAPRWGVHRGRRTARHYIKAPVRGRGTARRGRDDRARSRPSGRPGWRHARRPRADALEIRVHHHRHQPLEVHARLPAELCAGLGGVADQVVHFGGPEELRVGAMVCFCQSRPACPNAVSRGPRPSALCRWRSRSRRARPAAASATSPADVVAGEAPVAMRVEVAEASVSVRPSLMRATPSVTLRVTNSMPRRGDSWLKRMPDRRTGRSSRGSSP
jgi:hypothetical protein